MVYQYLPSFFRDVKKAPAEVQASLVSIIDNINAATSLSGISNVKKLKGHETAYRIKSNTYRICFFYKDGIITLARFLHRKEVYRYFP